LIFVGPFPIVIGSGPSAGWLVVISVLLTALTVSIFYLARKNKKETGA
jgi:uncharacterized membrane protein